MHPFLKLILGFYFSLLLFIISCNNEKKAHPTNNISVKLQTYRFDLDLFALDTNHLASSLEQLYLKYPDFLNFYLDTLMAYDIHGKFTEDNYNINSKFKAFLTYKDFKELEDTIKKYYPNTNDINNELTKGFQNMLYYFPSYKVPRIIYLDMELRNYPAFPIDTNTLCIGLDMFLGPQFPHYAEVGIPEYMNNHMTKTYLPVAAFSALYRFLHPFVQDDRSLLDMMIQRGKELYFIHTILPKIPEDVLFGFNKTQLDWCNKNEANIYHYFVNNNMLYNKENLSRFSYIKDGPFAQGMEPVTDTIKVSPGNVGCFIGYRIVSGYMEQNHNITLSQLVTQNVEPAVFLEASKYKPR